MEGFHNIDILLQHRMCTSITGETSITEDKYDLVIIFKSKQIFFLVVVYWFIYKFNVLISQIDYRKGFV